MDRFKDDAVKLLIESLCPFYSESFVGHGFGEIFKSVNFAGNLLEHGVKNVSFGSECVSKNASQDISECGQFSTQFFDFGFGVMESFRSFDLPRFAH